MSHTFLRMVLVSLLLGVVAPAQVPPKYEVVTIDEDPTYNYIARMNNCGQIVYSLWKDDGNTDAIEIVLYDNGTTIQLTDDDAYDRMPDINDAGQIVWARAVDGPGTPPQIVLWQDGELTQITDDPLPQGGPRINELGHIAWVRKKGTGCENAARDILFFDGQAIDQITNDEYDNQSPALNDKDWVVWTQYDDCVEPWESRIMLWHDGVIEPISPPETRTPQSATVNNRGQVAWTFRPYPGQPGVQVWESGATTMLTDWGGYPRINNDGNIAFYRWYESTPDGAYEVWLWRAGHFRRITFGEHDSGELNTWNIPSDINDLGEIVYTNGRPWYYETRVEWMRLREGPFDPVDDVEITPVDPRGPEPQPLPDASKPRTSFADDSGTKQSPGTLFSGASE